MVEYHVLFFYYGDLRADWKGKAVNEVAALTKALEDKTMGDWMCTGPGFRIEIKRAGE